MKPKTTKSKTMKPTKRTGKRLCVEVSDYLYNALCERAELKGMDIEDVATGLLAGSFFAEGCSNQ